MVEELAVFSIQPPPRPIAPALQWPRDACGTCGFSGGGRGPNIRWLHSCRAGASAGVVLSLLRAQDVRKAPLGVGRVRVVHLCAVACLAGWLRDAADACPGLTRGSSQSLESEPEPINPSGARGPAGGDPARVPHVGRRFPGRARGGDRHTVRVACVIPLCVWGLGHRPHFPAADLRYWPQYCDKAHASAA